MTPRRISLWRICAGGALRLLLQGPSVAAMRERQSIRLTQTQRLALNASLQASISVLRADAAGLTRYLEEQAAENPHLKLGPAPEPQEWLPRWTGVFAPQVLGGLELANPAPSLTAHVLAQIETLDLTRVEARIAMALVEALEPSGWLGEAVPDLARGLGVAPPAVEAVLARLQALEPAGLFARDLADCLRLQAREAGVLTPAMGKVLENLSLLASGDVARLARRAGVSEAEVQVCLREIRGMNPKPGAEFSVDSPAFQRAPDLLVQAEGQGWSISLNRSALPSLRVDAAGAGAAGALAQARAVERMVEARNATLLLVGREVVQRQQEALRQGQVALAPMTMADLAEALGCHESTISRVVAGTSLDTPHGTWWLRQMFSPALGGMGAPIIAGAALRARLGRLIGEEARDRPLSDAALTQVLARVTGVSLARRTVTKYRETLGIPPAHRRKARRLPVMGVPSGA
jgi:RNA polymerase sigma-54 factor